MPDSSAQHSTMRAQVQPIAHCPCTGAQDFVLAACWWSSVMASCTRMQAAACLDLHASGLLQAMLHVLLHMPHKQQHLNLLGA